MFRAKIPKYMKKIEEEYMKWASNVRRYSRLYPVSAKVIEHLSQNEGNYYGTTEKHQDQCCYTPHRREKIKRGPLIEEDEESSQEY